MPRASRLITGKFVVYRNDGTDAGADPDEVPVVGLVVYMTPAMERVKETTVPQTGFLETYWGTTGTDGVLKDSSGNTGIRVPVSVPENFTYKVVIVPPDGSNQAPFEFNWIIPSGTSALDLTTAIPVPANPGAANLDDWLAVVGQIETLRNETVTAKNAAETAKTAAETARTGAQTAQTGAQTARTGAQTAQTAAEAARDAATANLGLIQDAVTRAPSLIFNGGFELGSGQSVATGWTYTGDVARDTATATYKGVASLFFGTGVGEAISDAVPATAGRTIRLAAMHRSAATPAVTGGLRIQSSVDGVTWTQIGTAPALANSATWTESAIRREVPAGANWIRARIAFTPGGAAVRFDEVSMTDITPLVEAETAAAAANTAYQSSTASLAITGNMVTATRVNGTTYSLGALGPAGEYTDNLVPDAEFGMELWSRRSGAVSASTYVTTTGLPGKSWKLDGVGTEVSVQSADFQVQGGEQYRLSVSMQNKLTPTGQLAHVRIQWLTETKANISTEPYLSLGDTTWSEQTAVRTAPATARYARFLAIHANTATGGNFWFGKPRVRRMLNVIQDVPSSQVRAIEERRGRDAVFLGTSNVALTTSTWPATLCARMGWTERNFAKGSTGFDQADWSNANKFPEQMTAAINDPSFNNLDVGYVFVADGGNDARNDKTETTAATTVFNAAKTAFPNAKIICVPMLWGPNAEYNDLPLNWNRMTRVVKELRQVCLDIHVPFIEDTWTWHHGNTAAMIAGEVHYNATGNKIIADRVQQFIQKGDATPVLDWVPVPARAGYATAATGSSRGLSVSRRGSVVHIDGVMRTTASASAQFWATIPAEFRPTYSQELTGRDGTTAVPIVINPNGSLMAVASLAAGTSITVGSSYRID